MMDENKTPSEKSHLNAVLLALLVTFLWASSFVLIKIGMKEGLPPITFAGLRYGLGFFTLFLLVAANRKHRKVLKSISGKMWTKLFLLGILFYTITQGANFVGLSLLPANTVSLIYNFGPFFIALASGMLMREKPTLIQWLGVILSIAGALVYFLPLESSTGQTLGYTAALISVMAYSASSLLGREINLTSGLPPIVITTISMGIGGLLLLMTGGITQGFGQLDLSQWLIIGWLAVVNTAFAFTMWNKTLRTLSAVEASIINNTILIQVALLAWLFLNESLNLKQIIGFIFVIIGMISVQLFGPSKRSIKNY